MVCGLVILTVVCLRQSQESPHEIIQIVALLRNVSSRNYLEACSPRQQLGWVGHAILRSYGLPSTQSPPPRDEL